MPSEMGTISGKGSVVLWAPGGFEAEQRRICTAAPSTEF